MAILMKKVSTNSHVGAISISMVFQLTGAVAKIEIERQQICFEMFGRREKFRILY